MAKYYMERKTVTTKEKLISVGDGMKHNDLNDALGYAIDTMKRMKKAFEGKKEDDMTTEQILKEITEVTEEAYEKGYGDCIKDYDYLIRKLLLPISEGGISAKESNKIYGCNIVDILTKYAPEEALAKLLDYEETLKKKDEEIVRGDEVVCDSGNIKLAGIYLGKGTCVYYILVYNEEYPQKLTIDKWTLTKTGKHIDLNGGDVHEQ